jgi:hypothetical protein
MGAQRGARFPRLRWRNAQQQRQDGARDKAPHARLIKGLTRFATSGDYPLMRRALVPLLLVIAMGPDALAQDVLPPPTPQPQRRSWFSRINPFARERLPEYKDARIRGLVLSLELSPQPIKLSEVRQMDVKVTLRNKSKRPVTLEFPDSQRIEIYLRNSNEEILTTWTDNHAFTQVLGSVLINPQEHIDYAETIATRELLPNKVYIAEVFFPSYPELRIRQKFLTAP